MSTFLSLCTDLARESGTLGSAPSSVTDQTGRQAKVVQWVQQAWEIIQNFSSHWAWMRGEFEGTLTAGAMSYAAASLNANRFREWVPDRREASGWYRALTLYDPALGRKDETELRQISYEQWRLSFNRGVHDDSRPLYWAGAPDGSLKVGPTPDKGYAIRGEYWKAPQVLVANEDVPELPARHHSIIWKRALMLLTGNDEASIAYQNAKLLFDEALAQLCRDQLPAIGFGQGPIA